MIKYFLGYLVFYSLIIVSDVHVIGDSHGFFCFNNRFSNITADEDSFFIYQKDDIKLKIPFHIHWLGSRTMYRVGRDGINGLNIKKLGVKNNDIVIFQFGEVDVRCHIGRQRDEKKREIDEILLTLANSFINTIVTNRMQYNNLYCIVISVMPPSDGGFNPVYPYYGLLQERVAITKRLNEYLEQICMINKIYFFNVYDLLSKEDGSLNMDLSDGIVHVHSSQNYRIKNQLVENLFLKKNLFN